MTRIRPGTETALSNQQLQANLTGTLGKVLKGRNRAVAEVENWQELRAYAEGVKRHTLSHLGEYLETLEAQVLSNGGRVLWASDAEEARHLVVDLARRRGVTRVLKGKTMLGEEIGINEALEQAGIRPIETDLGEFIVQLAGEHPSHLIAPALHKSRAEIGRLLTGKLGVAPTDDPSEITRIARKYMRDQFLTAEMGITGVNFGVAKSGRLVIVENEGNVRLTSALPRIHVALMGIERLLPRDRDLAVFLKLLIRSATGQRMTSYVNVIRGPRAAQETDGPDEFYLVLVDNGRSRILQDPDLRPTLHCIRCGACQNVCPVFQKIGGHAYGSVYQGPIGAILTPQLQSPKEAPEHPFASSLCGACEEICPVRIPIPAILLKLRGRAVQSGERSGWEAALWKLWARALSGRNWGRLARIGRILAPLLRRLPLSPIRGWTRHREFPEIPDRSFREQFRRSDRE